MTNRGHRQALPVTAGINSRGYNDAVASLGRRIVVLTAVVACGCSRTRVDEVHRKLTVEAVSRLRDDLNRGCSAIRPYASERFRVLVLEATAKCEQIRSALASWQRFEPESFRQCGTVAVCVMGSAVLANRRREIEIAWLEGATVPRIASISFEIDGRWETIPQPLQQIDPSPPQSNPDRVARVYFPSTENASSTFPGNPPQLP